MTNHETYQLTYTIPKAWSGQTLDNFLRQALQLSRTGIRALKRQDCIRLDGKVAFVTYRLQGGENLVITLAQTAPQNFTAEPIPLNIVYENNHLMIINKPAGMVVHPTKNYQSGTLANALKYHWEAQHEAASFHPVHRLDRSTSGLILIAKNSWAHQQLDLQLTSQQINRLYLAVCCGIPSQTSAKIDLPLETIPHRLKRQISPAGKPAITRYRCLGSHHDLSLLAVKLYTGRTHQIRAHLAHLGLHLYGDWLYGTELPDFPYPALHSAKLSFIDPVTKKRLKFKANLPENIGKLLAE